MFKQDKKWAKRKMNRRQFLKIVGATTVTVSTVGFPYFSRGIEPKEILLGHIHPLSGLQAAEGKYYRNGAELAVEEINMGGGIQALGGAKIKLLTGDSQAKPEIGMSEAEKLIRAGIVALTGSGGSAVGYATTQVAEKYKVPHILETGITDNLTERGFKYTFRITPSTKIAIKNSFAFFLELEKETGIKLKTAIHLHEPTIFGTTISQLLKEHAPPAGIQIIESIKYNLPVTDLTSEIMRVKSLNPDILLTSSWPQDGMLIVRTLKQFRLAPKMLTGIFNMAFSNPNFVPEMGKDAEYIMDIDQFPNMNNPITQTVAKKYKEKFRVNLDFLAAYAYTAVYLFKDAVERAKSTDREAVKEAMRTTTMLAPLVQDGPIKFDENGQNINATVPMMQVQKGEIVIIKPGKWAQAKPILPFPKWEERS